LTALKAISFDNLKLYRITMNRLGASRPNKLIYNNEGVKTDVLIIFIPHLVLGLEIVNAIIAIRK